MKKIVATILLVVSTMFILASCGKFTCDLCKEEKSGKKYEGSVLGKEVVYCEDCHEDLEALGELFD